MKRGVRKPHKQVPAKVTAYVDEGIRDLVELLNKLDGVQTIDSCAGGDDYLAYVSMEWSTEQNLICLGIMSSPLSLCDNNLISSINTALYLFLISHIIVSK
jgi:hypothetical protein